MSAVIDADTSASVLEGLDFDPGCESRPSSGRCGREVTHLLVCTDCGQVAAMTCIDHAIYARRQGRTVTHDRCGARAPMSELVEVVPLWGS